MQYQIAIEKQMEWLRWSEGESGAMMWNHMEEAYRQAGRSPEYIGRATKERALYQQVLSAGDTYYISPQFCGLLERAAWTLPDTFLREDEVPAPIGFAYFDQPVLLPMAAKGDKQYHAKAIGWVSLTPEFKAEKWPRLIAFTFTDAPTGSPHEIQFWPLTYFGVEFNQSIYARISDFEQHASENTSNAWNYTDPFHGHEIQYLVSLFRMLNQKLARTRRMSLPRSTRRRLEKLATPRDHVQVVVLRRFDEKQEGYEEHGEVGEAVDWRWRWVVRGHWRQQWFPAKGEHRPVWIFPYVKGPEDKPMKDDQRKVFAVVR